MLREAGIFVGASTVWILVIVAIVDWDVAMRLVVVAFAALVAFILAINVLLRLAWGTRVLLARVLRHR